MSRYTVCVIRDFVAQHFLIGGDWGRENLHHSHPYRLEMVFAGDELDRHEYLLDIAVVKEHLDRLIERFADKTLNELPEFAGRNPSLELFARLLAEGMARALEPRQLTSLTAKLWENREAFATYTIPFAAPSAG
jgi:6-pyruvoyltetrahydropterin/6-carboxytetrahydropterin synthase